MPAALFTAVTNIIIVDMGVSWTWWTIKESIYPLNEILPLAFAFLAIEIWILKYTYGNFILFVITEVLLSFVFILLVQPWLNQRGIWVRINVTNFLAYLPAIIQFILIYLYQMWQEDALVPAMKNFFSPKLQSAATKPLLKNHDKSRK
jgi:thiol:disulfide interchange protein